jgi:hypothetical protein
MELHTSGIDLGKTVFHLVRLADSPFSVVSTKSERLKHRA